jgi:hypothetical protein
MKTFISKIFLIAFCTGIGSLCFAQGDEDKVVTARLKQKYSYVSFDEGYYYVKLNGKWGVIDKQGNEIVPPKYDNVGIFPFSKDYNYVVVELNEKYGVFDRQGKEVVAPKYDEILDDELEKFGYASVTLNSKMGVIDKQGKEIIPCEYTIVVIDEIEDATTKQTFAGLIQGGTIGDDDDLTVNGKWGLYDLDNKKWIAACKYEWMRDPHEGLAAFNIGGKLIDEKISGGKWGYLDVATGKEIIPAQYETAGNFKDGAAQVSLNGQTALIENPLAKNKANIARVASDVDANIPVSGSTSEETFAFIFANESYQNFSVPFANNDGEIFREYCKKTLGIPEKNVRFYENATIGNMASAVNRIKEIADTYDGDARFIVYYSGQGLTDESSKTPYLLPVDAVLTNLAATGYSVEKLNKELSQLPAKSTLLVLDACFNGCDREGKMLTAARSIAVKAKPNYASGSLIVISAATSDETAYQYKDKNHGLLTYFLLKKLQETKGDITYRSLTDYVTSEVKKQSISNSKIQSPSVTVSDKLTNWQTLKIR